MPPVSRHEAASRVPAGRARFTSTSKHRVFLIGAERTETKESKDRFRRPVSQLQTEGASFGLSTSIIEVLRLSVSLVN